MEAQQSVDLAQADVDGQGAADGSNNSNNDDSGEDLSGGTDSGDGYAYDPYAGGNTEDEGGNACVCMDYDSSDQDTCTACGDCTLLCSCSWSEAEGFCNEGSLVEQDEVEEEEEDAAANIELQYVQVTTGSCSTAQTLEYATNCSAAATSLGICAEISSTERTDLPSGQFLLPSLSHPTQSICIALAMRQSACSCLARNAAHRVSQCVGAVS